MTIDPSLCPLCAKANACALVDGGKTCWCFSANIDRAVIECVPVEQRGIACICRSCGRQLAAADSMYLHPIRD